MGGTIAVTIREKNGTTHKQARWTNALPAFVNSHKFIDENEQHFHDYIHHDREDHTYNLLAPACYGLLVVDQVNKQVLHAQGYCSFGDIDVSTFIIYGPEFRRMVNGPEADYFNELKDTYEKKGQFLTDVFRMQLGEDDKRELPPLDQMYADIKADNQKYRGDTVVLDMKPWTITKFEDDAAGFKKFRDAVKALGFILTEEEEQAWDEHIAQYEDDDDED